MTLAMFDSVDVSQIPADAVAAAGYTSGDWPTFPELAARCPHAELLSIAVNAGEDAECLDVETGDATAADIPDWQERQRGKGVTRPCIYADASTMEADVLPVLSSAKISRGSVRLWSAHYTNAAHICGPDSCKAVSIAMDGTQWTDQALGRNLDESLLAADFFAVPAPPAKPATVPQVTGWTTAGMDSLAQLAGAHHCEVSAILRLTAQRSPGALYPPDVATLINGVFGGTIDPRKPMPAGLRLYLPG